MPVHMMCRERGVLNVENLRNVDRIPRRTFTFIGLPLKVRNGCGSPIRAVTRTTIGEFSQELFARDCPRHGRHAPFLNIGRPTTECLGPDGDNVLVHLLKA
jgi:hypothetical protein